MIINPYYESGGIQPMGPSLSEQSNHRRDISPFAQGRTCIGSFKKIINPNTWKK